MSEFTPGLSLLNNCLKYHVHRSTGSSFSIIILPSFDLRSLRYILFVCLLVHVFICTFFSKPFFDDSLQFPCWSISCVSHFFFTVSFFSGSFLFLYDGVNIGAFPIRRHIVSIHGLYITIYIYSSLFRCFQIGLCLAWYISSFSLSSLIVYSLNGATYWIMVTITVSPDFVCIIKIFRMLPGNMSAPW